jgi:hypothetical protein
MTLHPIPLNFLIYEENFIFFFISVPYASNLIFLLFSHRKRFSLVNKYYAIYDGEKHCSLKGHSLTALRKKSLLPWSFNIIPFHTIFKNYLHVFFLLPEH